MPISFSNIPADLRIPLYWVEVDPSKAGIPLLHQPSLLVGTMSAAGKAPHNVPIAVGTQAQADDHYGVGSELSRMFKTFFANNFANEVWGLGVVEATGAMPSTGTITVTAAPTEAGTLHLYIAGQHVPVNIASSDTVANIGAAIVYEITQQPDLPVSASAAAGVVTLTSKWKSVTANDIRIDLNYYGSIGGEILPPGLALTLPATGFMTGGVGVPDWDGDAVAVPPVPSPIAALGEKNFEYVALPYTDSTSLNAWELEYGFEDVGRWGWRRQLYGHVFAAKRDTFSNLITFGNSRNSGVTSIMAVEKTSPSMVIDWVAAYTAKAQRALINDPARPLQTLSLNTVKLAPLQDRFDATELNALAGNGIATQKAGSDNQPMVARETTTYQLNLYGFQDDAYELVTTLATLARLIRNQRQAITSKYPRVKLADDGTRFGPGQSIVTPGIIKGELIAEYVQDMWVGLVENLQAFKANLIVERDPNDPNRVNVLYGPDLINQLRVFAVLAQFRLQYDRGIDTQIIGPNPGTIGMTGIMPGQAA